MPYKVFGIMLLLLRIGRNEENLLNKPCCRYEYFLQRPAHKECNEDVESTLFNIFLDNKRHGTIYFYKWESPR